MTREELFDKYGNYKYPSDVELTEPNTATSMPCGDAISRQAAIDCFNGKIKLYVTDTKLILEYLQGVVDAIKDLPPVTPQPKTGHCKDCKYFEYDSVAKVCGIPLIVAHEICKRWGDGCKTKEDGYCFLFESQERSDKE